MPAYNRASLIQASIDSVLAQEFQGFELIVVDDGSTDDTTDRVGDYCDRVHLIRQRNQGPGAARNLGIAQAQGSYITFLDSDDLWFPWTLRLYHDVLQKYNEPSFLAGTEIDFTDPDEVTNLLPQSLQSEHHANYFACREPIWIGTCAVAIRADIMRTVGGFASANSNAEDSDLWMRLGTTPGFARIVEPPVFAYRRAAGSAISEFDKTYQGTVALIENERAGRYPGGHDCRFQRWAILTRHVRPVSLAALQRGALARGWKLFRQTLVWHIRLGRLRYLAAFPLLLAMAGLKSSFGVRRS